MRPLRTDNVRDGNKQMVEQIRSTVVPGTIYDNISDSIWTTLREELDRGDFIPRYGLLPPAPKQPARLQGEQVTPASDVESMIAYAYQDTALPITHGQTCSVPSYVAYMTHLLELEPDMDVWEVGTGCGYHAGLVSLLLGSEGKLVTTERHGALARLGKENIAHLDQIHGIEPDVEVHHGDATNSSHQPEATFDVIYLTAGVDYTQFDKRPLERRLEPDGTLLIPEQHGDLYRQEYRNGYPRLPRTPIGSDFVALRRGTT